MLWTFGTLFFVYTKDDDCMMVPSSSVLLHGVSRKYHIILCGIFSRSVDRLQKFQWLQSQRWFVNTSL